MLISPVIADVACADGHGSFGATLVAPDVTRFRFWAPALQRVRLIIEEKEALEMNRLENGWFELTTPCPAGSAYRFQVDEDLIVPDPAARAMRGDAFGQSLVYDPHTYRWRCEDWKGRPWREAVFYELHVGAFGGFEGVMKALPRLVDLGVTAVELMPINAFPGERNWGYDGVLPYAPSSAYGFARRSQSVDRPGARTRLDDVS